MSMLLDQVTQQFVDALQRDGAMIQAAAKRLFFYLTLIQLSTSALWMSFAGETLQRFFVRLVQLSLSFGFFYALIQYGGEWIPEVINGFIQLGQQGGVQSLDPSSIVSQGVSIASAILKGFFNWGLLAHPFVSLVGAIVYIAVLVLYGLIAAELSIVLVKSYLVISVGGLFFAFGGSDFTREMTKRYAHAIVGLGLQLMTLYLLLGVGQNLGNEWAAMTANAAAQQSLTPMLVILCAVIVYYLLLKNIPPFVAGFSGVGGFRHYGDAAVGMAINAGMSGARLLSQGKDAVSRGIQGLGQASMAGKQLTKTFGAHHSVTGSMRAASQHLAVAGTRAVRDLVMRRNTHLSFGQKLNQHLANRVQKGESIK